MVSKPNSQPSRQRLQAISAMIGPGPPRDRASTSELEVRDRLLVGTQASEQDANIEVGVMGDQAIISDFFGDFGPETSKYRFLTHLLRGNSVNLDVELAEIERFGADHPHRFVDDFALPNDYRGQLTGAVGTSGRGFEVNCREIRRKFHYLVLRQQFGVRGSFQLLRG
jgi:hypothetical protein